METALSEHMHAQSRFVCLYFKPCLNSLVIPNKVLNTKPEEDGIGLLVNTCPLGLKAKVSLKGEVDISLFKKIFQGESGFSPIVSVDGAIKWFTKF